MAIAGREEDKAGGKRFVCSGDVLEVGGGQSVCSGCVLPEEYCGTL